MLLIGLGHISQAGKDTAAKIMKNCFEAKGLKAKICPLAWPVKDITLMLYPDSGLQSNTFYEDNPQYKDKKLPCGRSPRDYWMHIGEQLRVLDPEIWIKKLRDQLAGTHYDIVLIPDVRNPEEVRWLELYGGVTVRVDRGLTPTNDMDRKLVEYKWMWTLPNKGTIEDLTLNASMLADTLAKGLR